MKRPLSGNFAVLLLLLLGLCLSGCQRTSDAAPQTPQSAPPQVSVLRLEPQPLTLSTRLPGRVSAYLVAEVRPQVEGHILKRQFTEGSDVRQGQVLYQIDPAIYRAQLASTAAVLLEAEADLVTLQLKERRLRELVEVKAVSQQEYDDVHAALKQAQARIASAAAARDLQQIYLDYTRITAPISGRIGISNVTTGALVSTHQAAPLATIQQIDPVYVDLTQSSAELLRLKRSLMATRNTARAASARVRLELEDGSPYPQTGTLQFSDISVDEATGSVTLRCRFDNPQHLLLPGLFVRALVEEGTLEQALLVPQRAVSRLPDGTATVLLVEADGTVTQRPIEVERAVDHNWLVRSGLQGGEEIILEGIQKIRPGMKVSTVPFAGTAAE